MYVKSINIENIAGITKLDLNFNTRMNIVCGENGIGKTTILECVAHTFSASYTNILKRNALSSYGKFESIININNQDINKIISINDFIPISNSQIHGEYQKSKYLISLKVTRTFNYMDLQSVSKDVDKQQHTVYEEAKYGVNIHEIKNWFVNRYLYSAHDGSLTNEQLENLDFAKSCFSIIDENFSFNRVMASDNEIMINTPNGEIYYEYLSSGFKSIISILFGIIKDIEFRFKAPTIKAKDFDGIILIDELELHLHPIWQAKISNILKKVFPKVQFIVTTHSPHIIQNANPNEIIALKRDENGVVIKKEIPNNEFGFQGWTVEEVLADIMGMEDTRTEIYKNSIINFQNAITNENYSLAKEEFDKLNKLLHPDNYLRKLLSFDLASVKGSEVD
ncbi:AAA family ATPase [Aliarcobacter butzleri]|uniref:AAA family ATPase n=1 Tax=Aliarcobacter butzleri TaxID=28197 RepID=UPI001269DD93|nr:AAA family ATPase [Aliarcobacter butzleri]